MSAEIRRTIIIGLGNPGYRIAEEVQKRLQRRHNGVPIVQSITLLRADDQRLLARAQEQATILQHLTVLPVTLGKMQEEPWPNQSTTTSLFPDSPDLHLRYRAGARLALLDLYDEIKLTLSDVINKLLHPQSAVLMRQRQLNISPTHAKTIDIFIVANLAEPFASGMFIDLAYLVKKITIEEEADNLYFQVNGVLLLPPDRVTDDMNPASQPPESLTDEMKTMRWMQANSYAALKELDHYMNSPPYRLHYAAAGETVKFKAPPFEPGFCYLIGQTNENIQAISTEDTVQLIAEWFCHITSASIHARLAANFQVRYYGAQQAIGAYSSFGLSSLILPLQYIHDYCARRLAFDLATTLLSKPSRAEEQERARRDLQSSQILPDGGVLRRRLRGEPDENDQQYVILVDSYESLSVLQYQELEETITRHYDDKVGRIWPEIKKRILQNKNHLGTEIHQKMLQYTAQLFDHDPAAGINRSINFLAEMLKQLAERQSYLSKEIYSYEHRDYAHEIKKARGKYFNAAQSFGNPPFLGPTILTIIAFVLWFGWTYYILSNWLGYTTEARLIIAASLLLLLPSLWVIQSRPASTKAQFIEKYNSRLKGKRQLEEARLESDMIRVIEGWAHDLQPQIVTFRDEMTQLQALAEKRWQVDHGHEKEWQQLLYGHPYFSLEKSIIDQTDLEAYYKEVRGESDQEYRRHFARLFQPPYSGTYSTWLTSPAKPEERWQRLYDYCRDWATKKLAAHYIVEKIEERYDTNRVREEIERVKSYARPYLKVRLRGDLGEEGKSPIKESIAVHFEHGEDHASNGSKVAKALHNIQLLQNVDGFGEKERLSVITARRGLPLFILPDVVNCYSSYRQIDDLSFVHSTQGNIALPNISDKQQISDPDFAFELNPRQAFALAIAFSQYQKHPFIAITYQTEQPRAYLDQPAESAGYSQLYIDKRQLEMANLLRRTARQTKHYLGRTKSEACLTLYNNSELLAYLRQDLKAYLMQSEWRALANVLADYIELQNTSEVANLLNKIEDWEMEELEKALDIFLATLPSQ